MPPVGIPYAKLRTNFEVSSSNRFENILDCLPENLVENYLCTRLSFPRRSYVPNLSSLAEVVLKICLIVCQKFDGVK